MRSFPSPRPKDGDMFIDFTHRINKPGTENYQRWEKRLTNIEKQFGKNGDDSMWAADSEKILGYFTASKKAELKLGEKGFSISIPDGIPGSALTIVLSKVAKSAKFPPPKGGSVYRQGDKVWITTPMIGKPGIPLPKPAIKLAYKGKIKENITFEKAIKFAAIRLLQCGSIDKDYKLDIKITEKGNKTESMDLAKVHKWVPLKRAWGRWRLYPTLPEEKAPEITGPEF